MKTLKDYIFENYQQIDEVLLGCLVGAFAIWGIKTTFKTAESIKNNSETLEAIWDLVFESEKDHQQMLVEEGDKKKRIESKDIKPIQIPDQKTLLEAIKATKPSLDKDKKTVHGLYTLNDKIQKNKDLTNINERPYFPNYAAFVSKDKEILGMFGFSTEYWKVVESNKKDEKLANIAKSLKKFVHVFDMQMCPEYDSKPIYEVAWDIFEKIEKELKSKGMTIRYDDDEEKEEYMKHGFKPIKGINNILVKKS